MSWSNFLFTWEILRDNFFSKFWNFGSRVTEISCKSFCVSVNLRYHFEEQCQFSVSYGISVISGFDSNCEANREPGSILDLGCFLGSVLAI
jgi:hypothetical protein